MKTLELAGTGRRGGVSGGTQRVRGDTKRTPQRGCGRLWPRKDLREGWWGLRHVAEGKPIGLGLLASSAGNQGDGGAPGAAVARAVGEAVVLTAEGGGLAWFSAAIEVVTGTGGEGTRMVAGAEGEAGESAGPAEAAGIEGGAETRHKVSLRK